MIHLLNTLILVILLFSSQKNYSQNSHIIESVLFDKENTMSVRQNSTYTNTSSKKISNIIIYDWNNSYSSMDTPLSKKLYSEYDSSILKSTINQRGKTLVSNILVNNKVVEWERIPNNEDLIQINLNEELDSNEKIKLFFEYVLYIPSFISNYGANNNFINLKNCFFRFIPTLNGESLIFSNLDLDDQFFIKSNIILNVKYNSKFSSVTNLKKESSEVNGRTITDLYSGFSTSDIFLIFSKNNDFKSLKINQTNILSNSKKILSLKPINLQNISSFLEDHFPNNNIKKIIIDEIDFKKNSIYPYSEIPDFLDPFNENTLNEINFLKNLIHSIISNSLNMNRRELFWLSSGLELYYLNKFIDEYHSSLSLIGKYSSLFFIKNHNLSLMKLNDQFSLGYKFVSSRNLNQKLSLPSDKLTRVNYRLSSPSKSLFSLKILSNYIGEDEFKKSISKIFNSKNSITDIVRIKKIFEFNSSYNLDWFFNDYLDFDGLIDLKILKKKNNFQFKNLIGDELLFPVPAQIEYLNGTIKNEWVDNNRLLHFDTKKIKKIIIDPNMLFFDENYKNNNYKTFKDNPVKTVFRFFSDFDNAEYKQIFYRPQFLYNLYDGFSPGITLTNKSPIKKRFTYLFSPFYSFESEKLIGSINFNLTNYHTKTFSSKYYLSLSKFHYDDNLSYIRYSPTVLLTFRDKNLISNYKQFLRLKYIGINNEENNEFNDYGISKLTYINSNPGAKKSYSFSYDLQLNNEIFKNSITFNYRNYYSEFRQYNIRLFIGKFFKNKNRDGKYNFSVYRPTDYLYDNYLLGRSESTGFFSQQYVRYEGAFKSNIIEYNPDDFMLSLNTGITLWKWFEAYFDYGLFKNKRQSVESGFDTGLRLNIIENYFELFFPIYSSEGFYPNNKSYSNRIRFILTLDPENLSTLFSRRWF